jgi:chemotaxis protein MotB
VDDEKEMIIVRKKVSDGEGDHHGGVWKLAFADFMTAMMAFFLVMWLINSTSKETKATIVQYFNPVQLVDTKPAKKGLSDPKDSGQGASMQQSEGPKNANETAKNENAAEQGGGEVDEAALQKEPMKALESLSHVDAPSSSARTAGDPLADPFDRMETSAAADAPAQKTPAKTPRSEKNDSIAKPTPKGGAAPDNVAMIGEAVTAAVRAEMKAMHAVPKIDVKKVEEGILISLTDDANFSMFDVGSIKPRPELVRILEKIGAVLGKQPGAVEIAGHTDARAYKSGTYDNWRLSADRADIAYYMLVRGGLTPARVARISGFADRKLKTPDAPLAPVNRRIEILLRGERG